MLVLLLALSVTLAAPAPLSDPSVAPLIAAPDAPWRYAGPSGQAEASAADIAERILAAPQARHVVWRPELAAWTVWYQVPDMVRAVAHARVNKKVSYTIGGAIQQLTVAEIADRVRADPGARHLVWRTGMVSWLPAARLPEVDEALRLGLSAGAPPPREAATVVPPPPPVVAPTPPPVVPPPPVAVVAPTPPPVVPSPPIVVVAPPAVPVAPGRPTARVEAPPALPPLPPLPPVATNEDATLGAPPPIPGAGVDLSRVPTPPTTVVFAPAIPRFDFVPPLPGTLIVRSPTITPGDAETPIYEPPPLPGSIPDFDVEEIPPLPTP